eukprot:TRINITY_DN6600_c0_g1_i2.p1 TRINITY_DN6600_c0_g1~~TRINITY_DN6600_c0_g1_i2.p1  ORF type:complete len:482 (+),score=145.27 TRINITY_DN6600_c0_g1_i2:210-1655(+)
MADGGVFSGIQRVVVDECDRLLQHPFLTDIECIFGGLEPHTDANEECEAAAGERLKKSEFLVLRKEERVALQEKLREAKRRRRSAERQHSVEGPALQVVMTSATIPAALNALLARLAPAHAKINLNPKLEVSPTVEHIAYRVTNRRKQALLAYLLRRKGSLKGSKVLAFARTKQRAIRLAESLQEKHRIKASALHGGLTHQQQSETLESFRSGDVQCLVTTEVFSRGIDLQMDLGCVINYDISQSPAEYVHRVGRVGRLSPSSPPPSSHSERIEKTGKAISFVGIFAQVVSFGQEHVEMNDEHSVRHIERFIGTRLSFRKIPGPWKDTNELEDAEQKQLLMVEERSAQQAEAKVAERLATILKKKRNAAAKDSHGWKGHEPTHATASDDALSSMRERGRLRVKRKMEASTEEVHVNLRDFKEGRAESVFERWDRREGKQRAKKVGRALDTSAEGKRGGAKGTRAGKQAKGKKEKKETNRLV